MIEQTTAHRPSKMILVIGGLFLIAGLTFLIGSWGAYWTDTMIEEHGVSAEGHLEKKDFLASADGDSDYILLYWFITKNGVKIDASRHVSKDRFDLFQVHQKLDIQYSPNNPTRNFPTGEGVTSLGMTLFSSAFGLVFTCLGGGLIWGYVRQ